VWLWVWPRSLAVLVRGPKQVKRIDFDPAGHPFEAAQREVALASLDSAHVRPVNTHDLGKCFLAEIVRLPISPEISAKGPLKLALHK
jgi:hypothetical protein